MSSDFDLGDIYASTRNEEERKRQQEAAAREEAEAGRKAALKAQEEADSRARQAEADRLAVMNPLHRWIIMHKVATGAVVLSLLLALGVAALSLLSARLEQQRVDDLLLSCDTQRANLIPQDQVSRFISEWSRCKATEARLWSARQAGEPELEILVTLATDEIPEVRIAVVQNGATPSDVQEALTQDSDESVRLALAQAQLYLDQLASDTSPEVRAAVAQAPALSDSAMEQLVQDPDPSIKMVMLERSDLSRIALLTLARDGDVQICAGLPTAAMEQAAEEAESGDQWASDMLVAASKCPDDVMRTYAAREAIGSATLYLSTLAGDSSEAVRVAVAGNANASWKILDSLRADKSPDVRAAVAGHKEATPEALLQLAADPDSQVRLAVLRNPNTTEAALDGLASDSEYGIRLALAESARVSPAALDILSNAPEVAIRQAVAENDETPSSALARLARDEKTSIQLAVARNPSATTEVLLSLCTSSSFNVYLKAKRRLGDEYYMQCLMSANSF